VRALTTQEAGLLAMGTAGACAYSTYVKLEVDRDGSGTWVELTNLDGRDWFFSADRKESVDQPCASLSVTLHREMGPLSLAPLMEKSPLNLVGGVYTPMIDAWRRIRLYTAMMPHGVAPSSGDWRLRFDGRIDDFDAGGDDGTLKLECRDRGAELDVFIRSVEVYGSDGGSSLESQMQAMLTTVMGVSSPTLYTPVSPGWNVHVWQQEEACLRDALRKLAQQIGWDVRYAWRAATSQYELTLYCPDRTKAVPDLTLGPGQYHLIPSSKIGRERVRNQVKIEYTDRATGTRQTYYVEDAASRERFGDLYCGVGEASTSNIDSPVEAAKMGNGILSDLSTPQLEQTADMPYLYAVELGDLVRFSGNGVQFDGNKDLAVISISDHLSREACTTALGLRGKPAGGYERWLALECRAGIAPPTHLDVYMDGDQGFNRNVPLTILFDEATNDTAGLWDFGSATGTIKSTGVYEVTIRTLAYLPAGATFARVALIVNGAEVVATEVSSPMQTMPQEISHRMVLMSGSTVCAQFYFESTDLNQAYIARGGSRLLLKRVFE
jgi:hypothetical protein